MAASLVLVLAAVFGPALDDRPNIRNHDHAWQAISSMAPIGTRPRTSIGSIKGMVFDRHFVENSIYA